MAGAALLMSIRPQYAEKIFNGTKTVELRRVKPKLLQEGDLIFVYVSAPVKSLVGAFSVASLMQKDIFSLWDDVKDFAGISHEDYLAYFKDAQKGVAIFIKNVWLLPKPVHLSDIQKEINGFYPPQSFRYTTIYQVESFQ
jgi:predicted transcriptional regulator